MNKQYFNFVQGAMRVGICALMLSGTTVLSAQAPALRAKAKAETPKYEMKEVSGTIYDAATREPMAGVRVQALGNRITQP